MFWALRLHWWDFRQAAKCKTLSHRCRSLLRNYLYISQLPPIPSVSDHKTFNTLTGSRSSPAFSFTHHQQTYRPTDGQTHIHSANHVHPISTTNRPIPQAGIHHHYAQAVDTRAPSISPSGSSKHATRHSHSHVPSATNEHATTTTTITRSHSTFATNNSLVPTASAITSRFLFRSHLRVRNPAYSSNGQYACASGFGL